MYREITRANSKTKRGVYRRTVAHRRIKHRGLVALPRTTSPEAAGDESEELVAAISFGALIIISLACLLRAWF